MSNALIDELKNKKDELEKYSIFPIRKEDYKDEKEIDTDFEFFVFIDNHPKDGEQNNRPGFLKELHHCLCRLNWKGGKPTNPANGTPFFALASHEKELREWLKLELDNGGNESELITPLNWLKIAIERYPYRLFVVIDKDVWRNEGCNPFEVDFWKNKSPFLCKRICWIDRKVLDRKTRENGLPLKKKLSDEWRNHIVCKFLGATYKNKNIKIYISTGSGKISTDDILKTLPSDCFKADSPSGEGPNLKESHIIFQKHSTANKIDSFFTQYGLNYSQLFYFEFLSGSQFQLQLLGKRNENILLGAMECGAFNLAIFDERYIEWWNRSPRKKEILATRVLPISEYIYDADKEPFKISEKGCCLNEDYSIELPKEYKKPSDNAMAGQGDSNSAGYIEELIGPSEAPNDKIYPDIIVIHQGVMDKLSKLSDNKIPFDLSVAKDKISYIIITSGRGYPSNLPRGAKFLPFSPLEFFMMKSYPEKLLFLKIAMKLKEEAK